VILLGTSGGIFTKCVVIYFRPQSAPSMQMKADAD